MTDTNVKVMIGVPTSGFSRNDRFYDYYNMLDRPAGTPCMFARGQSPARNRNVIIEQALELDCTHVLFLDDDILMPQDTLARLLKHDKDIVSGYYLMRSFPHKPIIFDQSLEDGRCVHHFPTEGESGLIPIVNTGLGCCLIKIEVFKVMEKPWIRLGETEKDHWGDDIGFFNRVRKHGFEMFCDLDLCVGHIASMVVIPNYQDDKWFVKYTTDGNGSTQFPAAQLSPEEREALLVGVK